MQENQARNLIQNALQNSFDKKKFVYLVKNILNHIEGKLINILIVRLKKETTLERARTKQRNLIVKYAETAAIPEEKREVILSLYLAERKNG